MAPGIPDCFNFTKSCEIELQISVISGLVLAPLLLILVLVLVIALCCVAKKLKRARRAAVTPETGDETGDETMRPKKKTKGTVGNPFYNDLPMLDIKPKENVDNYHEITNDDAVGVTYDTVSGVQLPTQQKTNDIILSDYDVIGEDENLKTRKSGGPSSTLATYYDDVILPRDDVTLPNYDVVTRDGDAKSRREEVKWKPPAPPPSSSVALEYSTVTKDAVKVVKGGEGVEYNKLMHGNETSPGVPTPLLENYSKLQNRQHSSSLGQLPHQNNHSTPPHRDSARSHDHRGKDTDPRRSIDASQLVGTDSSPPPLIPPRDLLREEQEDSFYMNVNH